MAGELFVFLNSKKGFKSLSGGCLVFAIKIIGESGCIWHLCLGIPCCWMHYCRAALGQEESVCTHLALGAGPVPLEHWLGSQGCAPSPQSSRQVRLDTSSELQSNINVQTIMCTTSGFCVGSPALQDA